jgi:hypothetical protein
MCFSLSFFHHQFLSSIKWHATISSLGLPTLYTFGPSLPRVSRKVGNDRRSSPLHFLINFIIKFCLSSSLLRSAPPETSSSSFIRTQLVGEKLKTELHDIEPLPPPPHQLPDPITSTSHTSPTRCGKLKKKNIRTSQSLFRLRPKCVRRTSPSLYRFLLTQKGEEPDGWEIATPQSGPKKLDESETDTKKSSICLVSGYNIGCYLI